MRMRALLCSVVVAGTLTSVNPVAAQTSHRVLPGETVSEIAQRHGLSIDQLQAANELSNAHRIRVGQVLVIPSPGSTPAPAGDRTHRVAEGEALSVIARRYGTTTSALAAANGISDPHRVRAGTVLRIDGTSGAPTAPTAPSSHRVQRGEALSVIAGRYGTTTSELLRLNDLSDADHIRAGQVLQLRPSSAASSSAPASTSSVTGRYPSLPSRLRANPDRLGLIPNFERWAAHYGVPVEFIMAVTYLESGWQNEVVSHKGAVGIGQLMPVTSRWLADEVIGIPALDPTVPDDNIRMTAAFLSWLQRAMGSREQAIAAYYQGPTSVNVLGVFPVTEVYVTAVSALFASFRPA